jgi:hypothetical protein
MMQLSKNMFFAITYQQALLEFYELRGLGEIKEIILFTAAKETMRGKFKARRFRRTLLRTVY